MTAADAETLVETLLLGVCLFCANLLLMRRRDPGVYLPLALLFLFRAGSSVLEMVVDSLESAGHFVAMARVTALIGPLDTASPFLFWLYVRALTSEGTQRIPRLRLHLTAIAVVSLLIGAVAFLPPEVNGPAELPEDHPAILGILLIVLALFLADILFKIMIASYLILIIRRLRVYHKRLRDVFASTENRELHWIWMITISGGVYWLASVSLSLSVWGGVLSEVELDDRISLFDSFALLVLYWIIGIWGLRQRPGLIRAPVAEPDEPDTPAVPKYEKSALDDERAARIARKIEAAMVTDQLYREPNLSLWDLAKHIGVTSHYVSQTLSTQLSSSFFDYINRWRIKDAVQQLTTTDETILVIAYDVGFNSRSAFYKAFKRETGKTPSDLRG